MNAEKFAAKLKTDARADHLARRADRRPVRFRCYNIVLTYDMLNAKLWHMSVSEQYEAREADKLAFSKLLDGLKVPAHQREGRVVARQQQAGMWLPEVRHFMWPIEESMN